MDEQNIGGVSNNNPQSMQDSYSLLDGRIGLRSASEDWDLTVFGYNLGDEEYQQQSNINLLGTPRYTWGSPLMYGVSAKYFFGS